MHQCSATRIDSHCDYDGLSGSAAPRSADRRLAVCRRYGFCRRKLKLVTFQTPLASQFASKYLATPVLWIRVTGSILVLDTQVTNSWEVAPDRKSTRLNSSHSSISYAVFCLKKKTLAT